MLTCIVLCRILNDRSLWALGQTHDQRTIISSVTSNNPHQDGPQPWLRLFNFSHPEPITKVSIDRLSLLTVSLMNAFPYFGGCLWKDSCKLGTLINSAALEECVEERQTFLTDGKSFSEPRRAPEEKMIFIACSIPVEPATKPSLTFQDTAEKPQRDTSTQRQNIYILPNRCPEAVAERHLKCQGRHR